MTTIKKTVWARVAVLRAVLACGGLMMASSAMAGPAACAPVSCDSSCAAPAACCEPACDAPADCCTADACVSNVCEPACDAPAGCCSDGCVDASCAAPAACCDATGCVDSCDGGCGLGSGDGCGLFGNRDGGLFGKKSFLGGCGSDDCCDTVGDDCCDSGCGCGGGELGDPWTLQGALCPSDDCCDAESPWSFGGWVQAGYHSDSTGLFNSRPDELNLHQAWVFLERTADGSDGIGFGGRVDFMYGQDAGDTQAFGNPPGSWDFQNGWDRGAQYGFAMPQLYGEVAIGENLSIIAGHFYTLLGYEVVTAPDNFFYSHAFTMYNSEAFTHTGVLATYAASDDLTLYAGYTFGWDTGFDRYDLLGQDGSSFLGGFSTSVGDNAAFTYITTFGDFGAIGDGYSHSMVLDVAVTDNLNYVIQSDILDNDAPVEGTGALVNQRTGTLRNETVGINQYLFYTLSDRIAVGGRAEWWKSDSDSIYAITGGVNIRPAANLVIRPEVRYEWDPGQTNDILVEDENTIFGIDAIVTF